MKCQISGLWMFICTVCGKRYGGLSLWFLRYVFTLLFSHSHMQPKYFNTCIAPCPKVYQQGVLHVRFFRVVMACVFDPLLPGVCLHASCHTLFFRPYCSFFLSLIHLFLELFHYFYYHLHLRVFLRVEVLGQSHLNFGSII